MVGASDEEIAATDFILSILPPGDAVALAQRLAPALAASNSKPVYVDCNAVKSGHTSHARGAIAPTGCAFVDAGIIGSPPKPGDKARACTLRGLLRCASRYSRPSASTSACWMVLLSAASAMKMSYAGITKGTQALAAAMMLAATRGGSADALYAELQGSQKEMLAWLTQLARADAAESLSLGRGNARDRRLRRRDPAAHELRVGAAHFDEHIAEDLTPARRMSPPWRVSDKGKA